MIMNKITKPTLIINESIARANIKRMAEKARRNNLSFEPHFKTHQSKEVGEWYREEGVEAITVSSVSMASYFASNGWDIITIAFPVNILEINKINKLSSKITLTILIQEVESVKALLKLDKKLEILIEIDAGYHRSGVEYNDFTLINSLIAEIQKSQHSFKGFYCHAGNSYHSKGLNSIKIVYEDVADKMKMLKDRFAEHSPHIAFGDTPTCSAVDVFDGIDSMHPGNFVYYDYTQMQIGSCKIEDVASYLLCPIVALQRARNEIIVYGGGVHLSKEAYELDGNRHFGLVGQLDEDGSFEAYKDSYVKSVSQEHGIISTNAKVMSKLEVGDVIAILPIHSCMAVDSMTNIYTEKGDYLSKMNK